jgi:hypothetical protein
MIMVFTMFMAHGKSPFAYYLSVAFIGSLLLSGCAEKWIKPGASEEEFDAMTAACYSQAAQRFPPNMRTVQVEPAHISPRITQCREFYRGYQCIEDGGYLLPPTYADIDLNRDPRAADTRACYYRSGWVPLKD